MKFTLLFGIVFILTGCIFGKSNEIRSAEKIFTFFQCRNIDSQQLSHNPIIAFHERTLAKSKQKAADYIQSYKSGDHLFEIPLEQVIQQQYVTYKSACEFLGGVTSLPINEK